jgi:hypothetical protein
MSRQTQATGSRFKRRQTSISEIIYRLFAHPVRVEIDGEPRRISTFGAILLRLYQQELAGDQKALAVRLKFETLSRRTARPKPNVIFVDE